MVLEGVGESFPTLEHLWADAGYRGSDLRKWITDALGLSLSLSLWRSLSAGLAGCGFLMMWSPIPYPRALK